MPFEINASTSKLLTHVYAIGGDNANFELRVYKLRTKEALDFYAEQIYPRHLSSFPLFGIEAHGFWIAKEDVEPRLFVPASYAAGEEPGEVGRRYMQSTEFAEDIRNSGTLMYQTWLPLNRQS